MSGDVDRALRYVACGGSSTRSKRPDLFPGAGVAVSGSGPRFTTSTGQTFLDWCGSLGATTPLGYAHPKVTEAVQAQCAQGALFSLPHALEGRVAERLCTDVIPWAEQIKFTKTGSEACAGAIRIARAATGRQRILTIRQHYHGWHDWHAQTVSAEGVPRDELVEVAEDIEHACRLMHNRLAAVICEPITRYAMTSRSKLQRLIDTAHHHGVLVIFDEMVCGGRVALGGVSTFYSLTPDLATYGKALGGGIPFACIAGSEALMGRGGYVSGTYSGDALGLAACQAVLDLYPKEDILDRLWTYGREALSWFGLHESEFLPVFFQPPWSETQRVTLSQSCLARGLFVHPGYVASCAVMTSEDLTLSRQVFAEAIYEARLGSRCAS